MGKEKITRGNASQFFVAGELCRRGYSAVVTIGNTPNTDVLCSNIEGTKFVHIQVKTFLPGRSTCTVGLKAERDYGKKIFWILAGIPLPEQESPFNYYIIPSTKMAKNVTELHSVWLKTKGKKGQPHKDSGVRSVALPPKKSENGWDISEYKNKWELIRKMLK
jgi:hypothetical protein